MGGSAAQETPRCPRTEGVEAVSERHADLLRDESNLVAAGVERAYFPTSAEELASAVREAASAREPLTTSGARTGIVGGAVPAGSRCVISLTRMNRLVSIDTGEDGAVARVEAGLTLADLTGRLAGYRWPAARWYYPVDPTEQTAEIGGTIATDASGGRSFRHGPTRRWVRALRLVLADGRDISIRRGDVRAEGGALRWPEAFPDRVLDLPELRRPACKCAAGYRVAPDVDLVDLLVGSEGTLCVIAGAELALAPEPAGVLALVCFLPREADGIGLVRALKESRLAPLSIEYFDSTALDFARSRRADGDEHLPEVPPGAGQAVFLEEAYADEEDLDARIAALDELLAAAGGSIDKTWACQTPAERERARALRHGIPEAVNALIARRKREVPDLHKVGTDLAVPDEAFPELVGAYRRMLPASGLEYVIFGHAGESHLHVNMIPRDLGELERAKGVHVELARLAVRLGGAVTAEHGIGRLKRGLLEIQYGREGVAAMRRIKEFFDPDGILNPGVMFE